MASPKGISRQLGPEDNIGRCPHGAPLAMLKTRCPSCYIAELEATIARLQERVEEAEQQLVHASIREREARAERNEARALAERWKEWAPILEVAQQQDIKWKKPMPDIDFGDEAIYVWTLKAQEEMGELSAALLGRLIGKEGRGDVLEECYQLIAVLLRIARAAIEEDETGKEVR